MSEELGFSLGQRSYSLCPSGSGGQRHRDVVPETIVPLPTGTPDAEATPQLRRSQPSAAVLNLETLGKFRKTEVYHHFVEPQT